MNESTEIARLKRTLAERDQHVEHLVNDIIDRDAEIARLGAELRKLKNKSKALAVTALLSLHKNKPTEIAAPDCYGCQGTGRIQWTGNADGEPCPCLDRAEEAPQ